MAAHLTSSSLFYKLACETHVEIFNFVLAEEGKLGVRLVCKNWLPSINEAVKMRWKILIQNPPEGPVKLGAVFLQINKKHGIIDAYPKDYNYLELFRSLSLQWKQRGLDIPEGELKLSHSYHSDLQNQLFKKNLDQSLKMMGSRIWQRLYIFGFPLDNVEEMRTWISTFENKNACESVLEINLSDLGVCYLPIELLAFSELQTLNLAHNHMNVLPLFLGDFNRLRSLNLADNDLEELPESFPTWVHLKEVDFSDNPWNAHGENQIEEWKKNVALHNNGADPMEGVERG